MDLPVSVPFLWDICSLFCPPEPVRSIIWMNKSCSWFGAMPLYLLVFNNKKVMTFSFLFPFYFWLILTDPQRFVQNASFFLKLFWAYVVLFPKLVNSSICFSIFIFKHHKIFRNSKRSFRPCSFVLSLRVLYPAILRSVWSLGQYILISLSCRT